MPTTSPAIAAPTVSTLTLRKTRTAADFVHRHARSPLTRQHAADVLRAVSSWHAARPEPTHAHLTDLVAAVAECTGAAWLKANAADPDVAHFTDLATHHPPQHIDPHDLDDLLATILWARHAPGPATP